MCCCGCEQEKKTFVSDKAPKALGPYSVAVMGQGLVFASGQLGLDPTTNQLVEGIEAQTRQSLTNLSNVLEAAGTNMSRVVKTTVFLQDMGDFAKMNQIYGEFFTEGFPARSTVQVAALPKGGLVEIDLIALAPTEDKTDDCCEK